jgi:hypothetical protein
VRAEPVKTGDHTFGKTEVFFLLAFFQSTHWIRLSPGKDFVGMKRFIGRYNQVYTEKTNLRIQSRLAGLFPPVRNMRLKR